MASFESKRFFWYLVKVFFASNFINSSWISIKIGTNSQQIRLELLKKYFCVKQHGFDMVHFMAKWSHSYNLPAAFLNITPKPDMLKKIIFAQTFQPQCLRKG